MFFVPLSPSHISSKTQSLRYMYPVDLLFFLIFKTNLLSLSSTQARHLFTFTIASTLPGNVQRTLKCRSARPLNSFNIFPKRIIRSFFLRSHLTAFCHLKNVRSFRHMLSRYRLLSFVLSHLKRQDAVLTYWR